jgi:chromosome segregation ATPase
MEGGIMAGPNDKPAAKPATSAEIRSLADDAKKDLGRSRQEAAALRREEADLEARAEVVRGQIATTRIELREASVQAKELATRAEELKTDAGMADQFAAGKREEAAKLEREAEALEDKDPVAAADKLEEAERNRASAKTVEAEQADLQRRADQAAAEAKVQELRAEALNENRVKLIDQRKALVQQSEEKEAAAEKAEADAKIYEQSVRELEGQAEATEIKERGDQILKEAETGPTSMAPDATPAELGVEAEAVAASVLAEVDADAVEPAMAEASLASIDEGIEPSLGAVDGPDEVTGEPEAELVADAVADPGIDAAESDADLVAEPLADPVDGTVSEPEAGSHRRGPGGARA